MASKRKRSKPTRITEDEVVSGEGDGNAESSSYIDDTLSKIQQYIEQGSEDTPDCLERKLDEQPQASDDSYSLPPKLLRFDSTSIHDLENSAHSSEIGKTELLFEERDSRDKDDEDEEFVPNKKQAEQMARHRERQAARRRNESAEARERRLIKGRERQADRRKMETEEERRVRLDRHRLRQADRRRNESHSEREVRLMLGRQRQADRRKNESEEERKARLLKNRLRQAERRKNGNIKSCEHRHDGVSSHTSIHSPVELSQPDPVYSTKLTDVAVPRLGPHYVCADKTKPSNILTGIDSEV